jgi:Tol biopolymer transport system component
VFEGYHGATAELLVRDAVTGTVARLLAPGTEAMDPDPSPDGARLAFAIADYVDATGDIFVVNRNGTEQLQLTSDAELDDQPAWSPDGTRIAFRSFRTQREGDIWVMGADGSNPLNLTPDPLPVVTNESRPAWSLDGTRIAYASNAGGNIDIWTMAADGSDKVRLTNSPDLDSEPAWSPDGQRIVFRRTNASEADLYVVPASGGAAVRLALAGEQRMPMWSPDGARIVFVNQATLLARPELFSVNPNGTGLEPIVTSAVSGGSINPAFLRRP